MVSKQTPHPSSNGPTPEEFIRHYIKVPDRYQLMPVKPTDPPLAASYAYSNKGTQAVLQIFPVPYQSSLIPRTVEEIAEKLHASLSDKSGIVFIDKGKTAKGYDYICTIMKILDERTRGIVYSLLFNVAVDDPQGAFCTHGNFAEIGVTGQREAVIYSVTALQNDQQDDWAKDPYDPSWTTGLLKNQAEDDKYDVMFPEHPLSECRQVIKELQQNN